MGVVIEIFGFIGRVLRSVLTFIVSIPGMIVTLIASLYASAQLIVSSIASYCSPIIALFDTARDYIDDFNSVFTSSEYFAFFYNTLALDHLGRCLASFLGFVPTLLTFILFSGFFVFLFILIPFFTYRVVAKLIQVISAGFVKV